MVLIMILWLGTLPLWQHTSVHPFSGWVKSFAGSEMCTFASAPVDCRLISAKNLFPFACWQPLSFVTLHPPHHNTHHHNALIVLIPTSQQISCDPARRPRLPSVSDGVDRGVVWRPVEAEALMREAWNYEPEDRPTFGEVNPWPVTFWFKSVISSTRRPFRVYLTSISTPRDLRVSSYLFSALWPGAARCILWQDWSAAKDTLSPEFESN
jgi:hypothetical protein